MKDIKRVIKGSFGIAGQSLRDGAEMAASQQACEELMAVVGKTGLVPQELIDGPLKPVTTFVTANVLNALGELLRNQIPHSDALQSVAQKAATASAKDASKEALEIVRPIVADIASNLAGK